MKAIKIITIALLLCTQMLSVLAGGVSVSASSQSPITATVPERALVNLLTFRVAGESATVSKFIFECSGDLTNYNIGEFILFFDDNESVSSRGVLGRNNRIEVNNPVGFSGPKEYSFSMWLRAWNNLDKFSGKSFTLKLVGVVSDTLVSGTLPVVGATATLTTTPNIGNIILRVEDLDPNVSPMVNLDNQILAKFSANVWDEEDVVANKMTFFVGPNSAMFWSVDRISIVDENGHIVAGPVTTAWYGEDGTAVVIFTNSVTFHKGESRYTIRGKLSSEFRHNSSVHVWSPVNLNGWSLVGAMYGYKIEPWSGDMDFGFVPVATGIAYLVLDSNGGGFTIPKGSTQALLANLKLDTYDSAEDILVGKLRVCCSDKDFATNFNNIRAYLGTNLLNTMRLGTVDDQGVMEIAFDEPVLARANRETVFAIKADVSTNAVLGQMTISLCGNTAPSNFGMLGAITQVAPDLQVPLQFGVQISVVGNAPWNFRFEYNLALGSTGYDVLILQRIVGAPETSSFDEATKLAVIRFQEQHGIAGVGFVGPLTRSVLNALDIGQYMTWAKLFMRPTSTVSAHLSILGGNVHTHLALFSKISKCV